MWFAERKWPQNAWLEPVCPHPQGAVSGCGFQAPAEGSRRGGVSSGPWLPCGSCKPRRVGADSRDLAAGSLAPCQLCVSTRVHVHVQAAPGLGV